jgi:hypothetical protein
MINMGIAILFVINFIILLLAINFIAAKLGEVIINKNINIMSLEKNQIRSNNIVIFLNAFFLIYSCMNNFKFNSLIIIAIIDTITVISLCTIENLKSSLK